MREDSLLPIQNILKDEHGFHTFLQPLETGRAPIGTWICPKCQITNSAFDMTCFKCGWSGKR